MLRIAHDTPVNLRGIPGLIPGETTLVATEQATVKTNSRTVTARRDSLRWSAILLVARPLLYYLPKAEQTQRTTPQDQDIVNTATTIAYAQDDSLLHWTTDLEKETPRKQFTGLRRLRKPRSTKPAAVTLFPTGF